MRRAAVSDAMVSDADDRDDDNDEGDEDEKDDEDDEDDDDSNDDVDVADDALLPCPAGSDAHRGTDRVRAVVTVVSRAFSNSSRRRK